MYKRIWLFSLLLYFTFVTIPAAMGQTYIIKSGDTLWNLAQKFNTTVNQLQKVNKLKSPSLTVGAVLTIPNSNIKSAKNVSSSMTTTYSVKAGDSLWSIAKQFNLTSDQLVTINNLSSETLQIGQTLNVPATAKQTPGKTLSSTQAGNAQVDSNQANGPTKYTIKKGDSLVSVADLFDITVEEICNNNNLVSDALKVGQVITIPKKITIEIAKVTDRPLASAVSSEPTRGSSTTRDLLVEACKLIGTPYQSAGTTPDGFDCSGFVSYVFKAVGINMPRSSSEQSTIGQTINESELQPGDLVFFCTNGSSTINHVGICIEGNNFIHCSSNKGVVVNDLNDTYYHNCYSLARRVY